MRYIFVAVLAFVISACGTSVTSLEDRLDDVRSAAADFCACLPSSSEEDVCLNALTSLGEFTDCVDRASDVAELTPEVQGFIDCYEGKVDALRSCIDATSACDSDAISGCITTTGIYNCSAPATIQEFLDTCL